MIFSGQSQIHEAGFLDGFEAEFALALGGVIGVDLLFACAEEAHDFLDYEIRSLAFLFCAHGGAWHGGAIGRSDQFGALSAGRGVPPSSAHRSGWFEREC